MRVRCELHEVLRGASVALVLGFGAAAQTTATAGRLADGQQLRAQGRYAEARQVFAALLRDAELNHAPWDRMALLLEQQGQTEQGAGNYLQAEGLLNRAVALRRANSPDGSPEFSRLKMHLAELYLDERRIADAEALLHEATTGMESAGGPAAVPLAEAYSALAVVSGVRGKYGEAEVLLRRALALTEGALGPNHPLLASALNAEAGVLIKEHRYPEAVKAAERSWRIVEANAAHVSDLDRAATLYVLGVTYWRDKRVREAESCVGRALPMAEAIYGPDHPNVGHYLYSYAAILKRAGRKSEAAGAARRAKAILAQSARNNPTQNTVSVNALR